MSTTPSVFDPVARQPLAAWGRVTVALMLVIGIQGRLDAADGSTRAHDHSHARHAPPDAAAVAERVRLKFENFMASVVKLHTDLLAVDAAARTVTVHPDGAPTTQALRLIPDAEFMADGYWTSLDRWAELTAQHPTRVWLWIDADRQGHWRGVRLVTDGVSEAIIHGRLPRIVRLDRRQRTVVIDEGAAKPRSLRLSHSVQVVHGAQVKPIEAMPIASGSQWAVVLHTAGGEPLVERLIDRAGLELIRRKATEVMAKSWLREGLPGRVIDFDGPAGEAHLLMAQQAMSWTRALRPGDAVRVRAEAIGGEPIRVVVSEVHPRHEKTELVVLANGRDLLDLQPGRRARVFLVQPPGGDWAQGPPDLGRLQDREARIQWFLQSIYCTCGVQGESCAGDFYTLANCNGMQCHMPKAKRLLIGRLIDQGLTDREILDRLIATDGPEVLRSHLRP